MSIDVEKHFGHPVPYSEFSEEEISIAISDAQESIYRMLRIGTKQSPEQSKYCETTSTNLKN